MTDGNRALAGVVGLAGMAEKRPERLRRLDEVAVADGNDRKDKGNRIWTDWTDDGRTTNKHIDGDAGKMWKGGRTVTSARQQPDKPTYTDRIEKRWAEQQPDDNREEDTNR